MIDREVKIEHEGERRCESYNRDVELLSASLRGAKGQISVSRTDSDCGWTVIFVADGSNTEEKTVLSMPDHQVFAYMRDRVR